MKEAIRTVPESIYDPEFPDTSHFRSARGNHSALRRIKEEWGTSQWFLEFDISTCFHTIDRHRLLPIFKEEIDDPKFFYSIHHFSAGRLVGDKGPSSVPHSLLSALPAGNIYLHKLDQEIGRILLKYQIPIVQRIRSVLLKTSRIDDQENSREVSFAPQEKRAIIVERVKTPQLWPFIPLFRRGTPQAPPGHSISYKRPGVFLFPYAGLATFLNKPSSLLCAALLIEPGGLTPKAESNSMMENAVINNRAMRDLIQSCTSLGLRIELGGKAILVLRSEKGLARKLPPFQSHYLIRICYARYADDLLLGILGALELLIEIQKRIAHFLQSGRHLCWVGSAGSTIAARSTVEFLGTVIRLPPRATPIQFLRELEKRLRVKHRIHITACHLRSAIHAKFRHLGKSIPIKQMTIGMSKTSSSLLDAVQQAEYLLGTARVRSPQSVLWETVKHIRQDWEISLLHRSGQSNVRKIVSRSGSMSFRKSLYTLGSRGQEAVGHWARSISSELQIEAPIKKILRRLRDRGIISRRRPWPIHVACLTNVSDGDIVNWSAGIAISPLSYYRCCDNLYQVRTIVDHQIRWSAIFTLAHKHKSSARNIIKKYSKDSNIVQGGKTLAEFPTWSARSRSSQQRALNYESSFSISCDVNCGLL